MSSCPLEKHLWAAMTYTTENLHRHLRKELLWNARCDQMMMHQQTAVWFTNLHSARKSALDDIIGLPHILNFLPYIFMFVAIKLRINCSVFWMHINKLNDSILYQ